MKLALIGKDISHSRSPAIYKKLFDREIHYDLLDFKSESELPDLNALAKTYRGVNITSPYKAHYFNQVIVHDSAVVALGLINTLKFTPSGTFGTNTDLVAVRSILTELKHQFKNPHLILLGSGAMAKLTTLVAAELSLELTNLSRRDHPRLSELDVKPFEKTSVQNIVINACSREFIFKGQQSPSNIFWDFNYNFIPHQNSLPFLVKAYHDGQEMLYLQAEAAKEFWLN